MRPPILRQPWPALLGLVLAACTGPERVPESTRGAAGGGAAAPTEAAAPAPEEVPVAPPTDPAVPEELPEPGSGGTGTALDGAPTPPADPPIAVDRPAPRPAPAERVLPHLAEGTELRGVELLAASADGALEALRVRSVVAGVSRVEVMVLDPEGGLVVALPRARAAGPGELRIGPLVLSLDDRRRLDDLARGALDLDAATAVLRLAGLVVEEALERAFREGWDSLDLASDPDVRLLGVARATGFPPGAVPAEGATGMTEGFELLEVLPATLEGFTPLGEQWRGRVHARVRDAAGEEMVLVVGVAGRLPG